MKRPLSFLLSKPYKVTGWIGTPSEFFYSLNPTRSLGGVYENTVETLKQVRSACFPRNPRLWNVAATPTTHSVETTLTYQNCPVTNLDPIHQTKVSLHLRVEEQGL